jgi:hypothetical protein
MPEMVVCPAFAPIAEEYMNGIWTAALVVLAIWFLGFGSPSETRTIYLMNCDKSTQYGRCEGKATPSVITVRVLPESQRVIADFGFGAWSYGKCVVFDRDNWSCEYEDGSGTTGMLDGIFQQTARDKPAQENLARRFQVSSVRYWLAVLRAMF